MPTKLPGIGLYLLELTESGRHIVVGVVTIPMSFLVFRTTLPSPAGFVIKGLFGLTPRLPVATYKAINREAFANDVASCTITASDTDSVCNAVRLYNLQLGTLLDSHAPAKTRTIKNRNDCPWFNPDIPAAKRKCRRLERNWRSNGKLHIDRELWCAQKNLVNSMLMKAKRSHYVGLVDDCGSDSRKLFSLANRLLNQKQSTPLPRHTDSHIMAETFIQFFQAKVRTICDTLHPDESCPQPFTATLLETLHPTNPDEIQSILRKIPPKSCHGNVAVLNYLLDEKDLLSSRRSRRGYSPLDVAVRSGKAETARILLDKIKHDTSVILQSDREGLTPLHIAIEIGLTSIVEELICLGADVNQASNDGQTPLHTAIRLCNCKKRQVEVTPALDQIQQESDDTLSRPEALIQLLVNQGSKKDIKDNGGYFPVQYAKDEHIKQIVFCRSSEEDFDIPRGK
ncbi:uncharacterized protein LOC121430154 [Lytechinus variegatus]|uniref:uncharacterized protein LOC121430154 n=1 Tax=Lytechinus variegatus TaxID=7654 RepID=UPI001BB16BA5|nr:uncharacterized protein LOC121430154 [Lytechinus variegatus]